MRKKEKVYVETSVISYLTARPSRDLIIAAHQQITKEWWELAQNRFELYLSELVVREAEGGDKREAERRLEVIEKIPLIEIKEEAVALAQLFIANRLIPQKAAVDALHIATAIVHGMDYLLSWNCRHIANAEIRNGISRISQGQGLQSPIICTPEELMGG